MGSKSDESDNFDDDDISPLKQQLLKRNSLFGDEGIHFESSSLDEDDWGNVFDEDDPGRTSALMASLSAASSSNRTVKEIPGGGSSSDVSDEKKKNLESSLTKSSKQLDPTKQPAGRSSSDNGDGGIERRLSNLQNWQNPVTDKPHREKMTMGIAQLLLARKRHKSNDEKWVARVKAQARAFESQLYKNANSLDAYNDITTLKKRIANLADAFASHFKEAKRKQAKRGSTLTASAATSASTGPFSAERRTSVQSISSSQNSTTDFGAFGALGNNMVHNRPVSFRQSSVGSTNTASSMPTGGGNLSNMMGSNMSGITGVLGMQQQQQLNPQLQQQILAMQQQQQLLARQMGMGGGQGLSQDDSIMSMMGNSPLLLLNQLQQQHHQNPMQQNSLNMLQNNQNLSMMMGANGMNMMGSMSPQGLNFNNNSMGNNRDGTGIAGMMNAQGANRGQSGSGNSEDFSAMYLREFDW